MAEESFNKLIEDMMEAPLQKGAHGKYQISTTPLNLIICSQMLL